MAALLRNDGLRHSNLHSSDYTHALQPWLSAERDLRMRGRLTRLSAKPMSVQRQGRKSV